jgi:hypothetical protein
VASVATGQVGSKLVPVITLSLDAQDRSLIHHVHEVSDWVITVDRNMGIEFFDHSGKPGRPDYLIDHSPDMTSDFGHRLFITSRSLQELEIMLAPALTQYSLQANQGHAGVLLRQIRSLAGRLALKLVSSPAQRAEVLGLALARLYLNYQGVLRNQILLPLDAHLELYPDIEIRPLKFAAVELQASHWRFLMGAVGSQSTYIRQINHIMKEHRHDLSLVSIRAGINASRLPDHLKDLAHQRLDLAAEYIDDNAHLGEVIRPGRLVIVDLRDEFIEKDEALGLFVVLLQLFADVRYAGEPFNKLVVFDEAHKYIENPDLVASLIEVVREMRHKGTSIMVASQDPPSVPVSLIELSSQIMLHKFNSPAWLKHIQKANAALAALTPEKLANLSIGEAYVWSSKATDDAFSKGAVKIRCRPRVTRHGGITKTAVPNE